VKSVDANSELDRVVGIIEKSVGRGLLKLAVMILLEKTACRGYRVYKVIKEKIYRNLSLSTLYTTLRELAELKVIEKVGGVYRIGEKGRAVLSVLKSKYPLIIASIEALLRNA